MSLYCEIGIEHCRTAGRPKSHNGIVRCGGACSILVGPSSSHVLHAPPRISTTCKGSVFIGIILLLAAEYPHHRVKPYPAQFGTQIDEERIYQGTFKSASTTIFLAARDFGDERCPDAQIHRWNRHIRRIPVQAYLGLLVGIHHCRHIGASPASSLLAFKSRLTHNGRLWVGVDRRQINLFLHIGTQGAAVVTRGLPIDS
jgi:hypothetical protein